MGVDWPEALGVGHLVNLNLLPAPKHMLAQVRALRYPIEVFSTHEVDQLLLPQGVQMTGCRGGGKANLGELRWWP
ncbi:MAG: hypothetical protein M3315_16200, partial [Actinomycetota bacterium]|nr:hypothetical protein [Actinomycetota bacterium]